MGGRFSRGRCRNIPGKRKGKDLEPETGAEAGEREKYVCLIAWLSFPQRLRLWICLPLYFRPLRVRLSLLSPKLRFLLYYVPGKRAFLRCFTSQIRLFSLGSPVFWLAPILKNRFLGTILKFYFPLSGGSCLISYRWKNRILKNSCVDGDKGKWISDYCLGQIKKVPRLYYLYRVGLSPALCCLFWSVKAKGKEGLKAFLFSFALCI